MADDHLEVHRPQWRNEDLALLCGIANAGGGQLIVGGAESTRAKNVRRMYKTFETIPQLTQQAFGFACPAEPIMDGPRLCLEIEVPAATEPVSFEGQYYLYTLQGNKRLEGKELADFLEGRLTGSEEGSADGDGDDSPEATNVAPVDDAEESAAGDGSGDAVSGGAAFDASGSMPQDTAAADGTVAGQAQAVQGAASPSGAGASKPRAAKQASGAKARTIPSFRSRSVAAAKDLYLTNTDEYVLKVLNADGRATAPKIASLLGISESTVRRSFRRLKEYGMIERIGSDKAGYWKVNL